MSYSQFVSLEPGALLWYDYRLPGDGSCEPAEARVRICQWNIERAYKLHEIICQLRTLDADILCLQELDIGCARSGMVNSAEALANALNMQCVFVNEFQELASNSRRPRDRIIALSGSRADHRQRIHGYHGNAILSRYRIAQAHVLDHVNQPFEWDRNGWRKREPRNGRRMSLCAVVDTPMGQLLCYSVHLEVFSGIVGRLAQMSEVLGHARRFDSVHPMQVICGDLNTMAHGLARLHPAYCLDDMRWLSLGWTEAAWWEAHVFNVLDSDGDSNEMLKRALPQNLAGSGLPRTRRNEVTTDATHWDQMFRDLRNNFFYDPFDVCRDTTLRAYGGLFLGKLDWLLVRHGIIQRRMIGNHDYTGSDHKWLAVDVEPDPDQTRWGREQIESRRRSALFARNRRRQRWAMALLGITVTLFLARWRWKR